MKSSEHGRISDELLSAYIDNAVTEHERSLVEAAVAADAEVAWRLDTLLQTVHLLHSLPELALPRSFTLQESHLVGAGLRDADDAGRRTAASWGSRVASGWRGFWQAGLPVYRNLAAASLVLLLVLVGGNTLLSAGSITLGRITAPAAELASGEVSPAAQAPQELAAAEAPDEEAPLEEIAPTEPPVQTAAAEGAPDDGLQPADPITTDAEALDAAPDAASNAGSEEAAVEAAALEAAPAEAAEVAQPAGQPDAAESVAALPPPGQAARLLMPPEEAPGVRPPAMRGGEAAGLGGAAQSQSFPYDEALERTQVEALEQGDGAGSPPVPAQLEAAAGESTGQTAAEDAPFAYAAALDDPADDVAEGLAEDNADDPAASEQADGSDASEQAASPIEQPVAAQAAAPPSEEPEIAEPDTAEQATAVAALPTAQPLPEPAARIQTPEPTGTGTALPVQPLAWGLLAAAFIFGGLWWRSRRSV